MLAGHEGGPARRARLTPGIIVDAGIDAAMIEQFVKSFYLQVHPDSLFGTILSAKIANWEATSAPSSHRQTKQSQPDLST